MGILTKGRYFEYSGIFVKKEERDKVSKLCFELVFWHFMSMLIIILKIDVISRTSALQQD